MSEDLKKDFRLRQNRNHSKCCVTNCKQPVVALAWRKSFFSNRGNEELALCQEHLNVAAQMAQAAGKELRWREVPSETPAEQAPAEQAPAEQAPAEQAPAELARQEEAMASELLQQCKAWQITTEEEVQHAAALIKQIKAKYNEVYGKQQAILKPLRESVEATRKLFRPALTFYSDCEQALKGKLAEVHKAAEQAQAQALQEAHAAAVQEQPEQARLALQQADEASTAAQAPGVSYRKVWKFEITDATAVPREYCTPDVKIIKQLVAQYKGELQIPGVRVFEDVSVSAKAGT